MTKKDFRDFVTHDSCQVGAFHTSSYIYKRGNISILAECKTAGNSKEALHLAIININDNIRTIIDDMRTYWDFEKFAYGFLEGMNRGIGIDTLLEYRKDGKWRDKYDELNTYEAREDRQDFEEKEKEEI